MIQSLIKYVNMYTIFGSIPDFQPFFKETCLCNNSGEEPNLIDYSIDENYKSFIFRCPVGLSVLDFKNRVHSLSKFLNCKFDDIRFIDFPGKIEIRILLRLPFRDYNLDYGSLCDFTIPLGINILDDTVFWYNFLISSNWNMYIAGSSGSGKSNLLRLIVYHLIYTYRSCDIELSIVNTKKSDFFGVDLLDNVVSYLDDYEEINSFIDKELDILKERSALFSDNKCKDIFDYRSKIGKIPFRFLIIEELGFYKGNKHFYKQLERIASTCRSAGIFLILCTQLPNCDILPNTIKQNINTVIGLKTIDKTRSDIIFPDSDLQCLKGYGHAKIYNTFYPGIEFQSFFIPDDVIEYISKLNIKQLQVE